MYILDQVMARYTSIISMPQLHPLSTFPVRSLGLVHGLDIGAVRNGMLVFGMQVGTQMRHVLPHQAGMGMSSSQALLHSIVGVVLQVCLPG